MKKLKEIVEVENEGLVALLGKKVTIWCCRYIYAGTLAGVNTNDILLEGASIVYETGELQKDGFNDAQKLPSQWYVRTDSIESYGEMS